MSVDVKFTGSYECLMTTSLRSRTTIKPPAKDALDVGTISVRTVLTSMDPGWEVIPPEDIFVKKKLKAKVQNVINEAVKAILAGEESSQEDDDSNEEYNPNVSITEPLPRRPIITHSSKIHLTYHPTRMCPKHVVPNRNLPSNAGA